MLKWIYETWLTKMLPNHVIIDTLLFWYAGTMAIRYTEKKQRMAPAVKDVLFPANNTLVSTAKTKSRDLCLSIITHVEIKQVPWQH